MHTGGTMIHVVHAYNKGLIYRQLDGRARQKINNIYNKYI